MKEAIEEVIAKRALEGETYRRELTDLNKRVSRQGQQPTLEIQ